MCCVYVCVYRSPVPSVPARHVTLSPSSSLQQPAPSPLAVYHTPLDTWVIKTKISEKDIIHKVPTVTFRPLQCSRSPGEEAQAGSLFVVLLVGHKNMEF